MAISPYDFDFGMLTVELTGFYEAQRSKIPVQRFVSGFLQ